jgi:hypothetical protein
MDGTYSEREQDSLRKSGGKTPPLEDLGVKSKIILKQIFKTYIMILQT